MQAEVESVINFVLQQIKLFQADQEFLYAVDTIGFDRINNDEETGLIRAWLIQKLNIFKKIVDACSDGPLSKMLKSISFNISNVDYMSIVFELFEKCLVMITADQVGNGDAWDTFWSYWGHDDAFIEDFFNRMEILAGTLSQCAVNGQLEQAYDQALLLHEDELEENANVQVEETGSEPVSLTDLKNSFFEMIREYIIDIEEGGLTGTPYDSLEYILIKDLLDEYSDGYVWRENVVFQDCFLPSIKRNLENREESWCKQLYEALTNIGGICNSLYLPEDAYLNEDVWYFPVFICDSLDGASTIGITLSEFSVDEMFCIMSLIVLCRYLVRVRALEPVHCNIGMKSSQPCGA